MKLFFTITFLFFFVAVNAQIFLVKFKDGREAYGHLHTEENIDNLQYGSTKKTETLKFLEINSKEYVDVPSRSIDYFLFIKEGQPTYKYYALPVRFIDSKTNEISDKEQMGFFNLLIDGPLQVYGSDFLEYLPYKKNYYKLQHRFLGMGYYFFKTEKTDYVVLTKPQTYGGSWPGFSTISAFLSECPDAKKIFDKKYPGELSDKRVYEKMLQKEVKDFEKVFKVENKKMKKIDRDLKKANGIGFLVKKIDLRFYQEIADIYNANCGNIN